MSTIIVERFCFRQLIVHISLECSYIQYSKKHLFKVFSLQDTTKHWTQASTLNLHIRKWLLE